MQSVQTTVALNVTGIPVAPNGLACMSVFTFFFFLVATISCSALVLVKPLKRKRDDLRRLGHGAQFLTCIVDVRLAKR